jgi:hypothetical protein
MIFINNALKFKHEPGCLKVKITSTGNKSTSEFMGTANNHRLKNTEWTTNS